MFDKIFKPSAAEPPKPKPEPEPVVPPKAVCRTTFEHHCSLKLSENDIIQLVIDAGYFGPVDPKDVAMREPAAFERRTRWQYMDDKYTFTFRKVTEVGGNG